MVEGKTPTDRVRLLRFLEEGWVAGVSQAVEVVGYSVRTAQRWWQCYPKAAWRLGMPERVTSKPGSAPNAETSESMVASRERR
jgi:hypothetical protein